MSESVLVRLEGLEFPRRCPACGADGASARIEIAKTFQYQEDERETRTEILRQAPWFCAACAAEHERERWRPGIEDYAKRLLAGGGEVLGGAIVGLVGLYFLKEALAKWSLALLLFACWPLGTAWFLMGRSWRRGADRFVAKPTRITSAIDFTDDQAAEFEPAWVRFTIREPGYAAAFREVNRERIWNPGGAEAVAARQKRAWANRVRRWWWGAVVVAVVLFGLASWWFGWD